MVVDDEVQTLKAIKAMVEPLGLEVLAVADSREAAHRANTDKFDGVFLDAKMPFLDGFELTKIVRSTPANAKVPIVMLTGSHDVETMRTAFKVGVTFFLTKPINLGRLSSLVKVMRAPMLKERRRYARLPFRCVVKCQLGLKQFTTNSVDISEGGMLLEASGGANVGDELNLEFGIPQSGKPVRARAKVVRKETADRVALEFVNIELQDRQTVLDYITGRVTA
jgi:CheY-like chemotaxis protein